MCLCMGTTPSVFTPQIHRILTALIQTHGSGQHKGMKTTYTMGSIILRAALNNTHSHHITLCKIGSQRGVAVRSRGPKSGALWQFRGVGWRGGLKREDTYVYLWLTHVDVWQKLTQYWSYSPIKNKIFQKFSSARCKRIVQPKQCSRIENNE